MSLVLYNHNAFIVLWFLIGSVISLSNLDDSDSSKYLVWKKVQESLENLKEEAVVPKREMGLWTLLEGFLLLANALEILNED
ncbi:hypothetical protein HN51_031915 [Arachis hypogaea]